ncbi:hypothetical protein BDQ17DRAFT_240301 [Cyathus striatus]|nr:hypothetical protein BDQ17DRAFT_240301 [Cyathus striatus]
MHWQIRSFVLAFLAGVAASQLISELPLIVKSPYLQSWIDASSVSSSGGAWPRFWTGHNTGWASYIQVDGTPYQWTGVIISSRPKLTATSVTPTRTIFSFEAGPIGFNASYLSPLDPTDLVRQSLPFGYYYIDAWSLDGKPHAVRFYFDITGELLSNDVSTDQVQWNTTQIGNAMYHSMHLTSKQSMVEDADIVKDSTLYFVMENSLDMTWQTGANASDVRAGFAAGGSPLPNSGDTNPRIINDNWPVLSYQIDLGNITQTSNSVVGVLGLVRDPVVQYTTSGSIQIRSSYYWSAYNTINDIIQDVVAKFDDVRSKAIDFDNKVLADGGAISSKYNDLISFSLRMTFAAMDITIPRFGNGTVDTSDLKIFMKDIGSSGRVNPVEIIYAAFPAILYFNSTLAGSLLEPLLEYQTSSDYKNAYAAPDLGNAYPKVQGNSSDTTELALENCGNMLIMTLAHALKSGDGSLIYHYYDLLKGWADYLEKNTLHPAGYLNADGEGNPNLSNLALKGILGLYAMGKIGDTTGNSSDASHYQSQAQNYYSQWENLAVSSGHITSVYGDTSNWGLIYNLYAAKLLGSDLVSDQIYTQQSQFYASQIGKAPKFGLPYDTNDAGKAKSHWTMFTAATVSDSSLRDSLISMVWQRASYNDTAPFPTTYDPNTGSAITGFASSAQGATFAPLALNIANQPVSVPSSTPSGQSTVKGKTNIGAIAGGVVGGVVGSLSLLGLAVFFWRTRDRKQERKLSFDMNEASVYEPFAPHLVQNYSNSTATLPEVNPPVVHSSKGAILSYSSPQNNYSTAGVSASSMFSSGASSSGAGASSDLRTEVEQLRREMSALRSERLQDTEPPPLYDFDSARMEENSGSGREAPNSTSRPTGISDTKGQLR